ncbi:hypothetical protein DPMN_048460 [Dreissena polymorpha]|uniref:Uncharacterized protein n=1 Tax=Dreissena polymorpha TaxID=45954 RepID=A0A9D4DAX1_DREPO|nr:hypothetical protein DPMN_048460 [Dreissena polymorpha]
MEVTDKANNSIFTRRFALYDNESSVTADPLSAHGLRATSAASETGYRWQTDTKCENTINDFVTFLCLGNTEVVGSVL